MNEPLNDDERLAAFLEGRLDPREREEMLARLTTDDDAYDVFAHTVAILRQEEDDDTAAGAPRGAGGTPPPAEARTPVAEPAPDGVVSLSERAVARGRGRRMPLLGWLALAAMFAGIVLVAKLTLPSSAAGDPVRLAASLEHRAEPPPADWGDAPWSTARGDEGPEVGATPEERNAQAARAGAQLVHLSVAVQRGDAAETRRLAKQIERRFPYAGSARTLGRIAAEAGAPAKELQPLLSQATERIANKYRAPDALRVGAWLEAARFAAATQDAAFFDDARTRKMLDEAARITASNPRAHALVEEVRRLLPRAGQPPPAALPDALGRLLGEIASA